MQARATTAAAQGRPPAYTAARGLVNTSCPVLLRKRLRAQPCRASSCPPVVLAEPRMHRFTLTCRRQRAADPGDYPPVCGGAGQVLWQRVRAGPHLQLPQGKGLQSSGTHVPTAQPARHAVLPLWCAHLAPLCLRPGPMQAYFILDELLLAGELQETSKKAVTRVIEAQVGGAGSQQRSCLRPACPCC